LSDHSRFITADAALERNPATTFWGYDDASAGGAKAPSRSAATTSTETALALPLLALIGLYSKSPVPEPRQRAAKKRGRLYRRGD